MASATLTNWYSNKSGIKPVQNPNNAGALLDAASKPAGMDIMKAGIKPVQNPNNAGALQQQTSALVSGIKPVQNPNNAGAQQQQAQQAQQAQEVAKQQQAQQVAKQQQTRALTSGIKPVQNPNNAGALLDAASKPAGADIMKAGKGALGAASKPAGADIMKAQQQQSAAKAKAANAVGTYNAATVDPKLLGEQKIWNVGEKETVQGQAADIISKDSPLMQLARRQAMEQSGARGMLNSSAGIGAATDAVIGRALEIANPDAAAYGRAAGYNVDTANTFNKTNTETINQARAFNAGAKNEASQFGAGNQFTRQQDATQQGYTEKNKGLDQTNTKELAAIQQGYSVDNTALDFKNSLTMAATNQGYTLAQKDVDAANEIARDATLNGYNVNMAKLTNDFTVDRDEFAANVRREEKLSDQQWGTSERTEAEKFTASQTIVDGNIKTGLATLAHDYNLTENQQSIVGELSKGMGTYILNIQTNPDMKQETKDFLINQGWGDFKASVKMISNVGKIPDVSTLLKVG